MYKLRFLSNLYYKLHIFERISKAEFRDAARTSYTNSYSSIQLQCIYFFLQFMETVAYTYDNFACMLDFFVSKVNI